MLRFIAVESEKEDIPELEESPQAEEACSDPNLRPAGQAEIVLKPANRRVYGRLRRHHIALNHPSANFNRRGSDAASCCRNRCNRHNRDCNGPSHKDCIAAVSGRPHERGQYDSLFLENHPRFGRGQSLQFLGPPIPPMTVSRLRISIIFAGMANQFI
jgi:hypothetical protein